VIKSFFNFFFELKVILIAPLYFHFGHYVWFLNLAAFVSEYGTTIMYFFLLIFFLKGPSLYKDSMFQSFLQNMYKNYILTFNTLPLNVYFKMVFNDLINTSTFFIKKSFYYLKKKIK